MSRIFAACPKEEKVIMNTNDKNVTEVNNTRPDGMVMQIVTSLLCIGIGSLLIFMPGVNMLYLCYCFCAALIVVGVIMIVSYFVSEAYKRLNDYRFAIGVLLIILGCIELLRAKILAEEIMFIIGLVTLILAVIIMQSAVQMKILKSGAWVVQLIFTIVSLVGAIFVLIDFKPVMQKVEGFAYYVMVIVGVLCLISLVIEAIVLWAVGRKADKEKTEGSETTESAGTDAEPAEPSAEAAGSGAEVSGDTSDETAVADETKE